MGVGIELEQLAVPHRLGEDVLLDRGVNPPDHARKSSDLKCKVVFDKTMSNEWVAKTRKKIGVLGRSKNKDTTQQPREGQHMHATGTQLKFQMFLFSEF